MKANFTRRDFVKTSAALGAATLAAPSVFAGGVHRSDDDELRIGLIGCGGRGKGAAVNALSADPRARIVAFADVFEDQGNNKGVRPAQRIFAERGQPVSDDQLYVGFDAYARMIDHAELDSVIIATPPHFRPIHFEYAVSKGKHVFMEKPVATDPAGIRRVIAAAKQAQEQGLSIVAGTQRRHETCYLELIERLRDGAIGKITAGRVSWNQQGLWHVDRQPAWSDMEYQLRNWLYFTWLSGDHICEQHVHNLDVANWVMDGHPVKCLGLGGRQTRTEPQYGHIFDHFAIEYEYEGGRFVESFCRQQNGCDSRVAENFIGDKGSCWSSSGSTRIDGENAWRSGENNAPYAQEHKDLIASIFGEGPYLNEGVRVAESTLTAIMGRMSAYTGKQVTWEQALHSTLDLAPPEYDWIDLPETPVAMPGKTPLV